MITSGDVIGEVENFKYIKSFLQKKKKTVILMLI